VCLLPDLLAAADPPVAMAAYDEAVRAALSYLKYHPDKRSALKPVLTELVSRTKIIKQEAAAAAAAAAAASDDVE
jgi:hypothetical protein